MRRLGLLTTSVHIVVPIVVPLISVVASLLAMLEYILEYILLHFSGEQFDVGLSMSHIWVSARAIFRDFFLGPSISLSDVHHDVVE